MTACTMHFYRKSETKLGNTKVPFSRMKSMTIKGFKLTITVAHEQRFNKLNNVVDHGDKPAITDICSETTIEILGEVSQLHQSFI